MPIRSWNIWLLFNVGFTNFFSSLVVFYMEWTKRWIYVPKNNLLNIPDFLIIECRKKITCNFFTQTFIIVIVCYLQPSNLFQNSNKSFYLKTFMHATTRERDTCVSRTALNVHNSNWTLRTNWCKWMSQLKFIVLLVKLLLIAKQRR